MNIWLVSAVFLLFVGSASSQLPPWDNQLFDFHLSPPLAPPNPTISPCSNISIEWSDRSTASPASTQPYTITVICGGFKPILIANETSRSYNWNVGLPSGGPYIMFMNDANGYSGGDSLVFNVADPAMGTTCTPSSYPQGTLLLTSNGTTNPECSTLVVTATGGTAPYKMQIIARSRPPKTTMWTTPQMSYIVDMNQGEQFFVLVTDANGNSTAEGIHTVTNGDTGCYNRATTVLAGSLPTTLSYNPSSTFSYPSGGESTNIIQNTAATTLVTTVTAADGSQSTITLAPGASATIVNPNTPIDATSSPMPAIVGGVVGGAVLLFSLVLFLCLRRRATRAKQGGMQEIYDPDSMPIGASPYTPPAPGRDTAPLVGRMSSMDSTGSGHTQAPSTPGMSFFGGHNNPMTPGHEEAQTRGDHNNLTTPDREEPPAWTITIPATSPTDSNMYNGYSGGTPTLTESSSMHARSASVSSRPNGLPPGAMMPNLGGEMPEKARFVPASSSIVAPPSYAHGM